MPDTQTNAPEASDSPAVWLPVARAAARLGLSERTVQRRARRGELEAREVSDEQGKRLLIRLDLPTGADNLTTPTHAQNGEAGDTLARPADKLPTPANTSLTAHLVEENRFLRGIIEQLQRDGAETRQHLKRALELAPKQLAQGTDESARIAQNGPQSGEAGSNSQQPLNGAQIEADGEETPISYGSIADELERMLNRWEK